MKKVLLFVIVASLAVLLFGCGGSDDKKPSKDVAAKVENKKDTDKEDFKSYVNDVTPIINEIAQSFGKDFEDLKQQNVDGKINDAELGEAIGSNLVPQGVKLQDKVEQIRPPKKLRDTHELLINMIAKNQQAMTEIVAAISAGDASKITSANDLLTEARKLERDYAYEMEDIAKGYGLELSDMK
ncbi:hypothetical protein B4102_3311 [Heyndrickxia sporothermodurans]|uniref:Lipoprotein n=1 Tax=Heyndrickxia sporothermodurans TaxID=46224 RepID=A0A150KXM7_9BACI|nr:hypothetical protein [Heyndrickxia sporothermodurans]KYD04162.1 hypothetical protein B4102_3311 [Heyndrickxia sporothermodurans]